MSSISFKADCSKSECSCDINAEQEDFIYLCRKCGSGYVFKEGIWMKKFSFSEEAINQILALIEP